jgi:hypothetical protein
MLRATLFGRMENICVLREKAILQRKLFTVSGSGKGNGVAFSDTCIKKEDEVMDLYDFYMTSSCKYIESSSGEN